jgi:hypothetical protein
MKEVDDECSGFDAARWRICVGDQREEEEGWAGCYTALPSLSNLCLGVGGRAAEELDGGWWHSMKEVDDGCSGFDEVRWRICVGDQCG